MKVLVAVASKHGATRGIGEAIADELTARGFDVVSAEAGAADITGFDAAVVGSAVYMGTWLADARNLVQRIAAAAPRVPVWIFSSGLSDTPSKETNGSGEKSLRNVGANIRQHRHFSGSLDLNDLSLAERAVIAAARGKNGDRRDFAAIKEWADEIADDLTAGAS
ncbi:flavodoxin domain-containing protein [Rarobacter incanus]|uniref:Menaquinone-dependent protoporphyrinogen oxidase n=1 Tax=Rarobacter incanus TaxID=153494 RepID=A0A542SQX9_9MICO|nr:flavodoxin domain-containing protein [Rarobacter incanus]TQK77020.1 menaquinone-dependent protoporphyrinogen oxidase [Rarobacter incanus]